MTQEEQKKWEYLIKKHPERAGLAYELYLQHKTKDANITTYFMWAEKRQRQTESRYRKGLQKYCEREVTKMEVKNGNEDNLLFL